MSTPTGPAAAILLAALTLVLAACGSDHDSDVGPASSSATTPSATTPSEATTPTPIARTPELDAVGVIGHSGATGADSNGDGLDVPDNSWATGDNPAVDSVYQRLLATHPALQGHNWNEAVSGSDVDSLMGQVDSLLQEDPVPDLVLVQSIDNDIQCDGSDEDNYDAFESSLDEAVTHLQQSDPGVEIFFVDQWASVATYDDVAAQDPDLIRYLSGSGPCDTFTLHGKRNPKAEAYLQGLVDEYFERIKQVCAQHPRCATDEGAMQGLRLERGDLTDDYNHLMVGGQAKMAAIAWAALPKAWK